MREASSDGATIAHRAIGDAGGDRTHRPARDVGQAPILDVGVRHAGADGDAVVALLIGAKLFEAGHVNQRRRSGQAQVEHWPERLSARKDLGPAPLVGEQIQGGGERVGPRVGEIDRLHAAAPRARAIASRMRRGVIGECSTSAPSGRSASLIALPIAAGGAMAPPSPRPLTPNSV